MADRKTMFSAFSLGILLGAVMGATLAPSYEAQGPLRPLRIGQNYPCIVEIDQSVWAQMNRIGVYRWVVACEKEKQERQAHD